MKARGARLLPPPPVPSSTTHSLAYRLPTSLGLQYIQPVPAPAPAATPCCPRRHRQRVYQACRHTRSTTTVCHVHGHRHIHLHPRPPLALCLLCVPRQLLQAPSTSSVIMMNRSSHHLLGTSMPHQEPGHVRTVAPLASLHVSDITASFFLQTHPSTLPGHPPAALP